MPQYPPQQAQPNANQPPAIVAQATQLGRSIQREQGLRGVRAYVEAMRPFLCEEELLALAEALGVPCAPPPPPPPPPPQNPMGPGMGNMGSGMGNMAQMMQLLGQLAPMQGNQGGGMGGGMNPLLLLQLMGMMG